LIRCFLLLAIGVAIAAGCSKDITRDFEQFADRACACRDAACANAVLTEFARFAKDAEGHAHNDEARTNAAAERMAKCAMKAGVSAQDLMRLANKLAQ